MTLKLNLPEPVAGRQFLVTARVPGGWFTSLSLDDSFRVVEIAIPARVNVEDVEVFAQFVHGSGVVDTAVPAAVMKTRKRPKLKRTVVRDGDHKRNIADD
jgi:hypothetical protein